MTKKILELFAKPAPEEEKEALSPAKEEAETEDKDLAVREEELKADIGELLELFPKLKAREIPQEVWERVAQGDSLCGAYCVYLFRRAKEQLHIRGVNERLTKTALPAVSDKGEKPQYFTRDTVKNMPASEVRKHLSAILHSMDSWK